MSFNIVCVITDIETWNVDSVLSFESSAIEYVIRYMGLEDPGHFSEVLSDGQNSISVALPR